jgi:hypothetical protein
MSEGRGLMSFSEDLDKFAKKTGLGMDLIIRKLALDAFAGVMAKSPVDTGRFRSSWNLGVGTPDLSVQPPRDPIQLTAKGRRPPGAPKRQRPSTAEMAKAQAAVLGAGRHDLILITNNLPYGPPLERGSSKQAPNGMLRLTLAEMKRNIRRAIRD